MSNEHDDESADSQQESEQQPVDSDQTIAQSEEQSTEQTDQSTEQPEEQPADSDQAQEQSAESDQPANQTEGEPAEGGQQVAEAEPQTTDSDQPSVLGTADDTQELAGGIASPGGGAGTKGGGSGKTTKIQVIAKFMTNNANDPLQAGSITMNVFDGAKGTPLWKLGSFQVAASKGNIIKSDMFPGVTGNSVQVELKVAILAFETDPKDDFAEVKFGTEAEFEVPAEGPLKVDVDVETVEKEFTVAAKDESSAQVAARNMLANTEEIALSLVKSVTNLGAGKFRVVFRIPTKRILILHPKFLKTIY
jgi:hypothetical protein